MKKWVIASTAVLVILAGSGMYLLNRKPDLDAMMPQNSWAQAQSGTVEVTISGSGSISPSKRDSLEADTNSKVDEVLVSENQSVKEGEELITFTNGEEVIAPYDGIITKVQVKEDDRVQDQTAVLEIISSQELEAVVEVDELDISKVKTGQSASIKVNAFPEKTFTGKVTEIKPEGDVSNGVSSFEVSVKIDQPSNLKSGMTTQVTITAEKKENALVIPVEAIHSGSDGKYVWVPNRNQTKNAPAVIKRHVEIGMKNDEVAEITSGLTEGERVQIPSITTQIDESKMMEVRPMVPGMGGGKGEKFLIRGGGNRP